MLCHLLVLATAHQSTQEDIAQPEHLARTMERTIADMNNDGLADIVGFGIAGVLVGLNDGTI